MVVLPGRFPRLEGNKPGERALRAAQSRVMEQAMATKPRGPSGPGAESDRFTIVPSRKEVDPFSYVPSDETVEPYLPPAPGPVPPIERQEDSLPDERHDQSPEQTGDRPVFP